MAKFLSKIDNDITKLIPIIKNIVLDNIQSTALTDEAGFKGDSSSSYTMVFEKLSYGGNNKAVLIISLFQEVNHLVYLSALTSGGTKALLYNLDDIIEDNLLNDFIKELSKKIKLIKM